MFATRNIGAGVRIVEYKGERVPSRRYHDDGDDYVNLFEVGRGYVIDPSRKGNIARFINHSCSPNCESIADGGRIYIESIRRIRKGEEITYDYHLDLGASPTPRDRRRYACRCGSENCRGTLFDAKKPRKKKSAGNGQGKVTTKAKTKANANAKAKGKAKAKEEASRSMREKRKKGDISKSKSLT